MLRRLRERYGKLKLPAYVQACSAAAKQGWIVKTTLALIAVYEGVAIVRPLVDIEVPQWSFSVPKLPPFLAACVLLAAALILVIQGGCRLRENDRGEIEALKEKRSFLVGPDDWLRMGKEFEELYPHGNVSWKSGVWQIEDTNAQTARQYRVLCEKAGRMFDSNAADPVSVWFEMIKGRGYFDIDMVEGVQDIRHGGKIVQLPVKSKWLCTALSAECYRK